MKKLVKQILAVTAIILALVIAFNFTYDKIGFGYFSKAANNSHQTVFTRDAKIKYSNENSYKIENKEFNTATFYKTIKVKKNTAYKITCMVKTKNVESNNDNEKSGAKIVLIDRQEQSNVVTGTSDWTELTIMFNSKNDETIQIGFLLGENVKGEAWFSEMTLTEGTTTNSNWNFACFVFKNIDVTINEKNYQYSMTNNDINNITNCMNRFKTTCEFFSNMVMNVNYTIIEIDEPIKSISYDEEKGYYIDQKDVKNLINKYVDNNQYDYIFSCIRMSDEESSIPTNNWKGLGGMNYNKMGFSNIRMPDDTTCKEYEYSDENKFPEEVFVHEFLHTIENNAKDCGYEIPVLHDNLKYGYEKKAQYGLYKWYYDFMQNNVESVKGAIGVDKNLYYVKPITEQNFEEAKVEENCFNEPKTITEKVKILVDMII